MPLSGPEPPDATLSFPNLRRELARRFAVEMKAVTGRGPDHVRVFVNQNLVTLFAQGTLTPAEESLIEAKRDQAAQDIQTELQMVIRDRFSEAIEELTDHKVVSPLSDHGIDPDLSVYCFALDRDLVELT